jgi:hypothetical protein
MVAERKEQALLLFRRAGVLLIVLHGHAVPAVGEGKGTVWLELVSGV